MFDSIIYIKNDITVEPLLQCDHSNQALGKTLFKHNSFRKQTILNCFCERTNNIHKFNLFPRGKFKRFFKFSSFNLQGQ